MRSDSRPPHYTRRHHDAARTPPPLARALFTGGLFARALFARVLLACVLGAAATTLAGSASAQPSVDDRDAAPSPVPSEEIGFLGVWDRALPLLERASRGTGISIRIIRPGDPTDGVAVLFVLNLDSAGVSELIESIRESEPKPTVVSLDRRDSQTPLRQRDLLVEDDRVRGYWRANGLVNLRRLLEYTRAAFLGGGGEVEPPVAIPEYGFYHPDMEEIAETFDEYLDRRPAADDGRPVAALLIHQGFWITEDMKVIDAEIRALEEVGFDVVTCFAESTARWERMLRAIGPTVIVEDRHGGTWEGTDGSDLLASFGVPYLRPISMLASTVEEWADDPLGLQPRDRSLFLTLQESKGTIEPIVVGGMKANVQGFRLHEPIPDRVERFARRARRWATLQSKPNATKRIAIVYYNKYLGQSDLMRGSPTGAFLDGPRSLMRFLPRLQDAGFHVDAMPADVEELLDRMRHQGRNVGPWARGDLEAIANRPDAVLIPEGRYRRWFDERLPASNRDAVVKHFGPPPGRLMVVQRDGQRHIVLPGLRYGNVWIGPQPARGAKQDERLLHSRDVPPPHNYLALYWWLQDSFGADAVIHWGTHGSLELLPGKEAGLSRNDWSDLCAGEMPIINPWIMDNIGESTLSRRRGYAVLVDHLPPPSEPSRLDPELQTVHDQIHKFEGLEPGTLREEFRRSITRSTVEASIDQTLGFDSRDRPLNDDEIERVAVHLHEIESAATPKSLYVLGQPPADQRLPAYLVSILRKAFLEHVATIPKASEVSTPVTAAESERSGGDTTEDVDGGSGEPRDSDHEAEERSRALRARAEAWVRRCVLGDETPPPAIAEDVAIGREVVRRLRQTDAEITGIIDALEGKFVSPGPGPDPIRNRASVPSGRNLYALNPEEIPTEASWRVAVRLVDEMLAGRAPKKVGFDLNGMNTMRDYGVVEGQILYLLGMRPVWDHNRLAVDVEPIPRDELGRPRVDVFVAMGGQYKENFPSRVKLIDKAVRLAAEQPGEDNGVRHGVQRLRDALLQKGFSEGQAERLSFARVFGTKPGNLSGTHILHLIPRSGVWESDDEVSDVYVDNMSYVYTGDVWGEQIDGLYGEAIQETDTIVRVWASNMTSQLSNHHAYEYLGGLSQAVRKLTGREPDALIADVRDPDGGRIREFREVLAVNLRSELLNREWIESMMGHDYAGAGHMTELVKNTFGWDVTRPGDVDPQVWDQIHDTYVRDRFELGLDKWFEAKNPHASQEILATMLEAARKGYWPADSERLDEASRRYVASVAEHGLSGGLVNGGNAALDRFVRERVGGPQNERLVARYAEAVTSSRSGSEERAAEANREQVRGQRLRATVEGDQADTKDSRSETGKKTVPRLDDLRRLGWIVAAAGVLLAIGLWRRWGNPGA